MQTDEALVSASAGEMLRTLPSIQAFERYQMSKQQVCSRSDSSGRVPEAQARAQRDVL